MAEKILWVVNYDDVQDFLQLARNAGCDGVAIRSDNNLPKAVQTFHAAEMKVYAWRWPSARRDAAMNEAAKIVNLLKQGGLDGYFVDPEGAPGKPYDWDQPGLASLADDFCSAIKAAAPDKPLGITSHYRAKFVFPKIPWAAFFAKADLFLPQAYWRSTAGQIGHGDPADNYAVSIDSWKRTGARAAAIIPMAGELEVSKPADIAAHAAAARARGIGQLHFYASSPAVSAAVWSAVKQA